MSTSVSLRVRVLAAAGLIVALALGAGTLMLSRTGAADAAADAPEAPVRPKPVPAAVKARATLTPAAPARVEAQVAAEADNGLPAPIATALRRHRVVVVSVVSRRAPVDALALREARAGAKQAGTGFVSVEVVDQAAMERLTGQLGVRHTPTLLVFTRPNNLFLQVKGFADRETVAQAATNAAS